MVTRVATFPATDRLILDNMRLQSSLANTQIQLSTGLKDLNYKGIARETQRLLSLERNYDALKNYNVNSNQVNSNVNIMFNALNGMMSTANNFMQTLTAALGGGQVPTQVTQDQAGILMREMSGLLNIQSAGRYLFAGSMIDTPPVDLDDPAWTAQTPPSTANTSYYQGDSALLSVQLSDTMTLSYGVTADNPAFEMALRAFNLVYNNPTDNAALVEASNLMKNAIDSMANLQGLLTTASSTIETQSARNEEDMSVMDTLISNIKEVDFPATTVKQKELETQIQASYASSVSLLKLRLTDFI